MQHLRRNLVTAGLAVGAVVGGITLSGAFANKSTTSEQTKEATVVSFVPRVLMPPLDGDEQQLFSAMVTSATIDAQASKFGKSSISLSSGSTPGEVCYVVSASEVNAEGCINPEAIATGLSYLEFNNHGEVEIFGLVPDDVAQVTVGGVDVPVKNNVWHLVPSAKDGKLSLSVTSADGTIAVSLDH
jgi:hypothetical protein